MLSSRIARPLVALAAALALSAAPSWAGTGSGAFVFKGKVTNDPKETPKMCLTVCWTQDGKIKSETLKVKVKAGDKAKDVAKKVSTALMGNASINGSFTMTTSSSFGFHSVKLTPKKGNYAFKLTAQNGEVSGKPPKLGCLIKGLTLSGGTDPSLGDVVFDVLGVPTSGTVSVAANGLVAVADTGGRTLAEIEAELTTQLQHMGLDASLDAFGRIQVAGVNVDNLPGLGQNGIDGLEGILGGASSEVTDPGLGTSNSAVQAVLFVSGEGCSQFGAVPEVGVNGIPKVSGSTFTGRVYGVRPGAQATLLIGSSTQGYHGSRLPLDLAFAGLPGCRLYQSAELSFTGIAQSPDLSSGAAFPSFDGEAVFPLPIPPAPALIGVELPLQGVVVDPVAAAVAGTGPIALTGLGRALIEP